jgi:hypothetical protein
VSTDANNEMFSSYYDEEISRADLITDLTANLAVGGKFYRINDAVGATITLLVIAESNINLYQFAIDATTGEIGTYDITTDVFLTVSGIPDLQQVTDVGFTTTNKILSDDGLGNYTEISNGEIKIGTGNTGEVIIDSSLVTAAYNAQLPDKPTSPQTFAMLSDITGGVASVSSGTNISVDNTDPANPIINSLADRYSTSSVTSNTIGNGAKTFTVDADLAYIPLQEVLIVHNPSNHMHATVTSYSGTTLVVDVKTNTGSGTYISWVINLDGVPVDAITGVGTANEIAYFTGGQVIASLDTATYPSLTELSYVKGVTSAIQTQLNAIQKPISSVGNGTAVTGTTGITLCKTLSIPANSFTAGDALELYVQTTKNLINGTQFIRVYWNTSASLTGAILIASTGAAAANTLSQALIRHMGIEVAGGGGNGTQIVQPVSGINNPYVQSTSAIVPIAINWTSAGFIIVSIQNGSASDSSNCNLISLK